MFVIVVENLKHVQVYTIRDILHSNAYVYFQLPLFPLDVNQLATMIVKDEEWNSDVARMGMDAFALNESIL